MKMSAGLVGSINEAGGLRWLKKKYSNLNWEATAQFGQDDKKGIDAIGRVLSGRAAMVVQIKSSVRGALDFLEKGLEKGTIVTQVESESLRIRIMIPQDEGWIMTEESKLLEGEYYD